MSTGIFAQGGADIGGVQVDFNLGDFFSGIASSLSPQNNPLTAFVEDPLGIKAATAAAATQAAQNTYELDKQVSDTAKTDNLKIQQEKDALATLQTQQADALSQFVADQASKEQVETESEQANYTGAFQSIAGAEESIGGEQAQAVSNAQSLVAAYAARGIKVDAGTVGIAGSGRPGLSPRGYGRN